MAALLASAPASQACAPVRAFLAAQPGPRVVAERLEGRAAADAARRLSRPAPDAVLVIPTQNGSAVLAFVRAGRVCSHVELLPPTVERFLVWVRGVKI